jgi:hypothetical protein
VTNPEDPFAAPGEQPPTPPTPPPGYGAPPPGYGAPPPGYGAPSPGYGTPPPAYGQPYGAPVAAGTNVLAIIGFIASFLCGLAGIIMGVIAINQIKTSGQRGHGLAVAAIVIGSLNMVLGILWRASLS